MKEGDLITTYYKGFYRLKRIEKRYLTQYDVDTYTVYKGRKVGEEYGALLYFIQEYTQEGNPVKTAKEKCCDIQFCKLASDYISEEIKNMREKEVIFKNILNREK